MFVQIRWAICAAEKINRKTVKEGQQWVIVGNCGNVRSRSSQMSVHRDEGTCHNFSILCFSTGRSDLQNTLAAYESCR